MRWRRANRAAWGGGRRWLACIAAAVPGSAPFHAPPHPPSHRHELLTWQLPWGAANPWQLASRVMAGERLEVPPREALPGPDTAGWAGLDAYVQLMW